MISEVIRTCMDYIKWGTNDDQSKTITIPSLPSNVLQILTDIDCVPPKALFDLENDIIHLKSKRKFLLIDKIFLGAGVILTVATIASVIFGQILLASSLAILGIIATIKSLSSLAADKSVDKRVERLKVNINLVGQWLKKINARKQQNYLSQEQLKVIDEVYLFGMEKLQSAVMLSK